MQRLLFRKTNCVRRLADVIRWLRVMGGVVSQVSPAHLPPYHKPAFSWFLVSGVWLHLSAPVILTFPAW